MINISILGDLKDHVKTVRNRLAFAIDARVVRETPVDTSQARRNWLVTENRQDFSQLPAGSASLAISNGAAAISAAKPFSALYIQNNMPYIERLNEGWSEQAPAKYIDRIIDSEVAKLG